MNRDKFEAHCVKHVQATMAAFGQQGEEITVENICWKNEDGSYGVIVIRDAWIGYQWAMVDAVVPERQQVSEPCDFT